MIHPDDAARDGIAEGQMITVSGDGDSIQVPARITKHVNRGEALLVNSFSHQPVNKLMRKDNPITLVTVRSS
jgi:anaerobic selenocysteine-containing dehydrogenase